MGDIPQGNISLKKILFISHSSERTGAPVVLYTLVTNLDRKEFEASVIFPEQSELVEQLRKLGFSVEIVYNPQESLASQRSPSKMLSLVIARIRYVKRLHEICRKGQYDTVYINSLVNIFPGISAFLAGKKVVWHIHETFPPTFLNRLKAWFVKRFSKLIIFASPTCKRLFEPIGGSTNAAVVPNGIAPKPYMEAGNADYIYDELDIARGDLVITTIGYVDRIKGIDVLLKAMKRVTEVFPSAKLLIVGDNTNVEEDYRQQLKAIIEENNLDERVRFTGTRRDIPEILSISHLFVLPSRMESFPVVLLEAMAAGKPIVATRVGCVEEILDFGKAGYLVAPDDAEHLANAITAVLKDESLAGRLSREARQRVVSEYSLETFIERIRQNIETVLV